MKIFTDLHSHSKYSRAVSPQMVLPVMAEWAAKKGIDLVGTGDFTHPLWFREIKSNLKEVEEGIYQLNELKEIKFLLTSEVSCIYSDQGKGRRVHLLIIFPKLTEVEQFNRDLIANGANLFSDGRPILGLSLKKVAQIALNINPKVILIPAHAWTPWFGIYGQNSGYQSLTEAFADLAKDIPAVETGLSSDPAMNWRMEELKNRTIVSFSDAHSPAKIGREATVFQIKKSKNSSKSRIKYQDIYEAITGEARGNWEIASTIEFYPEEGKYHFSGHRKCGVVYSPSQAKKMGLVCPVCGRSLTPGVMSRVESLAKLEVATEVEKDKFGVRWIYPRGRTRPPYIMMVPLLEILAEVLHRGAGSQKLLASYDLLIRNFGSEFKVLLETPLEEIKNIVGEKVAEAIGKVRSGDISVQPGYDGVFGKVRIWAEKLEPLNRQNLSSQQALPFEPIALDERSLFMKR